MTDKDAPTTEITVDELKQKIDSGQQYILLDVRTPGEFARGKIAGSINVPIDELSNKISRTVVDTSSTVYVYCLSGSRSMFAVDMMRQMKYTHVINVTQGLLAWRAKGFPVIQ